MLIPRAWFEVTIGGFIYVIAIFFFILSGARRAGLKLATNPPVWAKSPSDYLPYIAVIVVFSSYILGYSMHLATEEILTYIWPSNTVEGVKLATILEQARPLSNELRNIRNGAWGDLVMFRHLLFSTILLYFSLAIFFWKTGSKGLHSFLLIVFMVFFFLFLSSYLAEKNNVNKIKEQITLLRPNQSLKLTE